MRKVALVVLFAVAALAMANTGFKTPKAVEAVPGEYLVKLKSNGMSLLSTVAIENTLQAQVKSRFQGDSRLVTIKKPVGMAQAEVLQQLRNNPAVEYVEPNFIYHADKVANDPDMGKLWGMKNTGQADSAGQMGVAGVDINAERAWDITTGSKDIVVAVIDTGIDASHKDLAANLWTNEAEAKGRAGVDDDGNGYVDDLHGYNFVTDSGNPQDGHGHGTHCSGTIGGVGNDGKGIVGVNWNVRIMAVKFLSDQGSGSLEDAVKAIDYATSNGAMIQSNSWGGGGFSQAMQDAIERANKKGVLFVAAAGNDADNNDSGEHYPANYEVANVLSVAAIDNQGKLADFSNWGRRKVHVAAPGVNVYSSIKGNTYASWSGTSMATPHVSGVAALVLSHERMTGVELKKRLVTTAHQLPTIARKVAANGMVDAYNALTNTIPEPIIQDPSTFPGKESITVSSAHPYEMNKTVTFTVRKAGAKQMAVHFARFETEGKYDTVSFKDADGNTASDVFSGTMSGEWSPVIDGDTMTITFTSDDTVNGYGFDIDQIAFK